MRAFVGVQGHECKLPGFVARPAALKRNVNLHHLQGLMLADAHHLAHQLAPGRHPTE